jgi:hypothetical protein
MFTECVTAPSRTSATFLIEDAFGVEIANGALYVTWSGAEVIWGRGASPDPFFLNRYGGENTSAFFAR